MDFRSKWRDWQPPSETGPIPETNPQNPQNLPDGSNPRGFAGFAGAIPQSHPADSARSADPFEPVRQWLRGEPPEGIEESPDWAEWRSLSALVGPATCRVVLMPNVEQRAIALFARWCPGTPDRTA